jgi:hypothetical protein
VRQRIKTALGVVISIGLYLPVAQAAGVVSKTTKTPSPASTVHLDKSRVAQFKADRKPKEKMVLRGKKALKMTDGRRVKSRVLPVEKTKDATAPAAVRVAARSIVDQGEVKAATNTGDFGSIETQNVKLGQDATKTDIYATVVKVQRIYVPQRPGCDAISNYRQLRSSDIDNWRSSLCVQIPGNVSLDPTEQVP